MRETTGRGPPPRPGAADVVARLAPQEVVHHVSFCLQMSVLPTAHATPPLASPSRAWARAKGRARGGACPMCASDDYHRAWWMRTRSRGGGVVSLCVVGSCTAVLCLCRPLARCGAGVVDARTRAVAVWSARVVRVMGVARVTSVVPPPPGQEWKGECGRGSGRREASACAV
jgi:hypothetical protein